MEINDELENGLDLDSSEFYTTHSKIPRELSDSEAGNATLIHAFAGPALTSPFLLNKRHRTRSALSLRSLPDLGEAEDSNIRYISQHRSPRINYNDYNSINPYPLQHDFNSEPRDWEPMEREYLGNRILREPLIRSRTTNMGENNFAGFRKSFAYPRRFSSVTAISQLANAEMRSNFGNARPRSRHFYIDGWYEGPYLDEDYDRRPELSYECDYRPTIRGDPQGYENNLSYVQERTPRWLSRRPNDSHQVSSSMIPPSKYKADMTHELRSHSPFNNREGVDDYNLARLKSYRKEYMIPERSTPQRYPSPNRYCMSPKTRIDQFCQRSLQPTADNVNPKTSSSIATTSIQTKKHINRQSNPFLQDNILLNINNAKCGQQLDDNTQKREAPCFSKGLLNDDAYVIDLQSTVCLLQKENTALRMEVESAAKKLTGTMNSIRSFWSPELKRERQTTRDETSKAEALKERLRLLSRENQKHLYAMDKMKAELDAQEERQRNMVRVGQGFYSAYSDKDEDSENAENRNVHDDQDQPLAVIGIKDYELLIEERENMIREIDIMQENLKEYELQSKIQKKTLSSREDTIKRLLDMLHKKNDRNGNRESEETGNILAEDVYKNGTSYDAHNDMEDEQQRISKIDDEMAWDRLGANLIAAQTKIDFLEQNLEIKDGEIHRLKDREKMLREKRASENDPLFYGPSKIIMLESLIEAKEARIMTLETEIKIMNKEMERIYEKRDMLAHEVALGTVADQATAAKVNFSNMSIEDFQLKSSDKAFPHDSDQMRDLTTPLGLYRSSGTLNDSLKEISGSLKGKEDASTIEQEKILRQQIENLRTDLNKSYTDLSGYQARYETLQKQQEDYQKHIAFLKETISAKDAHAAMLQTDIDALRKRAEELHQSIDATKLEAKNAIHEKKQLSHRVSQLDQQLDFKEQKLVVFQRKVSSLESLLEEKDSQLSIMLEKLREFKRDDSNDLNKLSTSQGSGNLCSTNFTKTESIPGSTKSLSSIDTGISNPSSVASLLETSKSNANTQTINNLASEENIKLKNLEKLLEDKVVIIEEKTRALKEAQKELSEMKDKLRTYEDQNSKLMRNLTEKDTVIKRLESEKKKIESDKVEKNSTNEKKIHMLQQEIQNYQVKLNETQEKYEESKEQAKQTMDNKDSANTANETLRSENEALKQGNQTLQERNKSLELQITKLNEETEKLRKDLQLVVQQSTAKESELKKRLSEWDNEMKSRGQDVFQKDREIDRLTKVLKQMERDKQQIEIELSKKEQDTQNSDKNLQEREQSLHNLIEKLREEIKIKDQNIQSLNEKLIELGNELDTQREMLDNEKSEMDKEIHETQEENADLKKSIYKLQTNIQKKEDQIKEIDEELKRAHQIISETKASAIHSTNKDMELANQTIAELRIAIKQYQTKLEEQTNKLEEITLQLQNKESDLKKLFSERKQIIEDLKESKKEAIRCGIGEKDAMIALLGTTMGPRTEEQINSLRAEKERLVQQMKHEEQSRSK